MEERIVYSYEFGPFRLIPAERQLLRDDQSVALPPKAFDTLVALVRNHGHALKKDELIKLVWPDSFVEESNLNHNISVLRKALSNGASGEGYVETVRGYGFRFKADVQRLFGDEPLLIHKRTRTHVVVRQEERQTTSSLAVITRSDLSRRATVTLALLVMVVVVGISAAYFGYIRNARSLGGGIPPASNRPGVSRHSANPEARELYLKGRYFLSQRTPDGVIKAGSHFLRATQLDPNYALAYVGMADCQLLGGSTPASTETAKSLALKAISLNNELAEAHATLAYYLGAVEWNWLEAEREFDRSIALDPNYPTARHWHAYNLASLGRIDDAVSEIRKARELDPLSIIINTDNGHILYLAQRYDEAIAEYLKTLQLNPDFRVTRWRLGEAYIQTQRYDEAMVELKKAISLEGRPKSDLSCWVAYAAAARGDRKAALQILAELKGDFEARNQWFGIALIYAGLRDHDTAFDLLEKALQVHDGQLALIKVEPMLKGLRDDPRYVQLLRRMNLPE